MFCPSCSAQLKTPDAATCWNCTASFGTGSSLKPTLEPVERKPARGLDVWIYWGLAFGLNAAVVFLWLALGIAAAGSQAGGILIAATISFVFTIWLSVRLVRRKRFGWGAAATFLLLPIVLFLGNVFVTLRT